MELVLTPDTPPRMLLVEDDPVFAEIIARVARRKGASIKVCASAADVAELTNWDFDVALVDFGLGDANGLDIARYVEAFTVDLPVILMSASRQQRDAAWPGIIREFVIKALGPYAILDAAFESHDVARVFREIEAEKLGQKFGKERKRKDAL